MTTHGFTAAEHVLSYIANEPPTGSRQLRATPEGVDILIGWLEEVRGEVDSRWSEYHCFKYDEATGRRSQGPTSSRVRGVDGPAHQGGPAQAPAGRGRRHPRGGAAGLGPGRDRPGDRRRVGAAPRPPGDARSRTGSTPTAPRRGAAPSRGTTRRRRWRGSTRTPRRSPSTGRSSRLAGVPARAAAVAGRGADRGPRPRPSTTAPPRPASAAMMGPTRSWPTPRPASDRVRSCCGDEVGRPGRAPHRELDGSGRRGSTASGILPKPPRYTP